MTGRILLAAILAGIVAGLTMSALQHWRVTPIIIAAEAYETADAGHDHGTGTAAHHHDAEAWAPEDGLERTFWTVTANLITGVAFAMLAVGAAMLTGLPITPANGPLWGLAGFATFMLAPWAGLPPELPGMPAADLFQRQLWWWAAAAATAGGIGLIVAARGREQAVRIAMTAAAVVLIALPHIVGAPHPDDLQTAVPASLANAFAANSIAVGAVFWLVLGVSLGWFLARDERREQHA